MNKNPYTGLNISENATTKEIKKASISFEKLYHQDINPNNSEIGNHKEIGNHN